MLCLCLYVVSVSVFTRQLTTGKMVHTITEARIVATTHNNTHHDLTREVYTIHTTSVCNVDLLGP